MRGHSRCREHVVEKSCTSFGAIRVLPEPDSDPPTPRLVVPPMAELDPADSALYFFANSGETAAQRRKEKVVLKSGSGEALRPAVTAQHRIGAQSSVPFTLGAHFHTVKVALGIAQRQHKYPRPSPPGLRSHVSIARRPMSLPRTGLLGSSIAIHRKSHPSGTYQTNVPPSSHSHPRSQATGPFDPPP